MVRARAGWIALVAAGLSTACELTSVTVADPQDELIVEGYVVQGLEPTGRAVVHVMIHRTLGGDSTVGVGIDSVLVEEASTGRLEAPPATPEACYLSSVNEFLPGGRPRCFQRVLPSSVGPGSRVELTVKASDGRVARGATTVPGDFDLLTPVTEGRTCRATPDTRFDMLWTQSQGAWAYPAEVRIEGLREALTPVDPDFSDLPDAIELFGLAISSTDTVISFPNEFGLFDRFDGDDLFTRSLVEIQDGLPAGTTARVTLAAGDRNYINWERGGNFNPSGFVRVPSIRGDAFGVFGSMVLKTIAIEVGDPVPGREACTP